MPQPYLPNNNTFKIEIAINGQDNGLGLLVKEMEIVEEVNKITTARIKLASSNLVTEGTEHAALKELNIYDNDDIIKIAISLVQETNIEKIFEGIIKSYNKQIEGQEINVTIECKDICIQLTNNLPVLINNETSYKDTCLYFAQAINAHVLNIDEISESHENIHYNSNVVPWDYMVAYADSVGYWTCIKNGTIKFVSFKEEKEALYIADNAVNVFDYKAKLEPARKKSKITLSYWNIDNLDVTTLDVSQQVYKNEEIIFSNNATLSESTYFEIINSRLKRSNLASIYGYVKTFGNTIITIGDYIQTKHINNELDDKNLIVSKIEHQFQENNWKTIYHFGLELENSFLELILNGSNTVAPGKIGQTNTIEGLTIGIVTALKGDPNEQYRIQVKLPLINNNSDGIWARNANVFATKNAGAYWLPNIGDEVIVGFLGNNLDNPIILGSMYSPSHSAPINPSNSNAIKGFYTPAGSKIEWNDGKNSIEISNNKGDKILISDQEKGIEIHDQNYNYIKLNEDGIILEAPNDIVLKAGRKITIEGAMMDINAQSILNISGSVIKLN